MDDADTARDDTPKADTAQGDGTVEAIDLIAEPADRTETGVRHLSPSSAGAFDQCPQRWKFRYLDRRPDPPGQAALAGTFAHRVLELLLQAPPADRTVDTARTIARAVWPEIAADPDFAALQLDEAQARHFRWVSWNAIEGLWTLEDPSSIEVEATEHQVETTLGGIPFRGIVDRLDVEADGLVVTDYKSGRAPPARYREGRLAQVLLYAAAVGALRGELPRRARLLYLGQKTVETTVDDDTIGPVVDALAGTWGEIQTACASDEFDTRTGPLCAWCPYVAECPAGVAEVSARHERGAVRLDAPGLAALPQAS